MLRFCNQAPKSAVEGIFTGYWQVSFSPSDPRWNCSKPVGLVPLSWSAEGERDRTNDSRNGLQVLGKRSLLIGFLHFMLQLLLQFCSKTKLQWSLSKTLCQRMVFLSFFNLMYLRLGKARKESSVFCDFSSCILFLNLVIVVKEQSFCFSY